MIDNVTMRRCPVQSTKSEPTVEFADLVASMRPVNVGDIGGKTEMIFVKYKFSAGVHLEYVYKTLTALLSYRSPVMNISLVAESETDRTVMAFIRFGNYCRSSLAHFKVLDVLPEALYRFNFEGVYLNDRQRRMMNDIKLYS